MKKIFYSLLLIVVISCNKKFNPDEYKGTWININEDSIFSYLPSITFKKNSIYFTDLYNYTTKSKFLISDYKISYF